MSDRILLTLSGKLALEEELRHLKNDERPLIIEAIAEARSHGDLSENADYQAAKEKQAFIEGRIQDIGMLNFHLKKCQSIPSRYFSGWVVHQRYI